MVQDNNSMNGKNAHNGQHHDDSTPNIIRFSDHRPVKEKKIHPPMINLPLFTKILLAIMITVQVIVFALGFIDPQMVDIIFSYGGFIPASWSPGNFQWWTPLTLLTFSFLHDGWIHLGINVLMLAAFGSGIEKMLGAKRMLQIFAASTLAAIAAHFLFNIHSMGVVVGVSGAISGYFGALLWIMKQQNTLGNAQNSMTPFIVVWIVTTIGFGMMGAPGGGEIAWVAHIGGFFGGLGAAWWLLKPSNGLRR